MSTRFGVIIDGENLFHLCNMLNKNIDIEAFLNIYQRNSKHKSKSEKFTAPCKRFYHASNPLHNEYNSFMHLLKMKFSFQIVDVPLIKYRRNDNGKRHKSITDAKIIVDVMEDIFEDRYDHLVLISGDGDFIPLTEFCRKKNIMVDIWGTHNNISASFLNGYNKVYNLNHPDYEYLLFDRETPPAQTSFG